MYARNSILQSLFEIAIEVKTIIIILRVGISGEENLVLNNKYDYLLSFLR